MGKYKGLLAIAIFLAVTSEVLSSATSSYQTKTTNLASGGDALRPRQLGEGPSKRVLRRVDVAEENNKDASAAVEERGFQSAVLGKLANLAKKAKLPKTAKNLQFRSWLKARKDPNFVLEYYGLKGVELAIARKTPNFELWLEYSRIWGVIGGR
ncbi:hypothetical protein PRIC2_013576 [Phytophthora ramorum]